jgi:hypothetical protein
MKLNNLIKKQVNFQNVNMTACKTNEKVFVGIRSICDGLGIVYNGQMERINRDDVLPEGVRKIRIPTSSGEQETNMLDIEYLPFFLVGIKSSMCKEEIRPRLKEFKLKAKDVLAEAFIKPQAENSMKIVSMLHEEIGQLINVTTDVQSRVSKLEQEDYIKPFQKKALINARISKVFEITGGKQSKAYKNKSFRSKVYQDIFRNIKNIYNVNEYDAIPKQKFSEALRLIKEYQLPLELKYELQKVNSQQRSEEEAAI